MIDKIEIDPDEETVITATGVLTVLGGLKEMATILGEKIDKFDKKTQKELNMTLGATTLATIKLLPKNSCEKLEKAFFESLDEK